MTPSTTNVEQHVDLLNLGTPSSSSATVPPQHQNSAQQQGGALFDLISGGSGESTQPDITISSSTGGAFADFSDFSASSAPHTSQNTAHSTPSAPHTTPSAPHSNGNIDLLGGFESMPTVNGGGSSASGNVLQPGRASSHASSSSLVDQDFMNFMGGPAATGTTHASSTENILNAAAGSDTTTAGLSRPASFANQSHLNTG